MVRAHIVRSAWTWNPGIADRVERNDFTLKCHLPRFWPCCAEVSELGVLRLWEPHLVVASDVLADEIKACGRSIHPPCQSAALASVLILQRRVRECKD